MFREVREPCHGELDIAVLLGPTSVLRLHSHCTIFCKRVNALAEIRNTNPLQCLNCKIFLQSEHCKGFVWRISARAFTRLQKIVQCERSLSCQFQPLCSSGGKLILFCELLWRKFQTLRRPHRCFFHGSVQAATSLVP